MLLVPPDVFMPTFNNAFRAACSFAGEISLEKSFKEIPPILPSGSCQRPRSRQAEKRNQAREAERNRHAGRVGVRWWVRVAQQG